MCTKQQLISLEELDLNQQQKVLQHYGHPYTLPCMDNFSKTSATGTQRQPEARKTIKIKSARRSKKCELMLRVKKLELRIFALEQTISSTEKHTLLNKWS